MRNLEKIGMIIYALLMAFFGFNHFMNADMMAERMVPSFFGGASTFLVYLTGIALIAAAVAIITNKMRRLASLLLAAFLLIVVALVHIPMAGSEVESEAIMGMTNTLKDLGLMATALIIAGRSS